MEARPRHRAIGAGLAASAVLALLAGATPVAAQDDAIPAGLPASAEESIAAAGRTQDASFCGTEPITLGIYDGGGINAWSQASFAAANSEAAKCPNVTTWVAGAGFDQSKAISDLNAWLAQGVNAITIIPDAGVPGAELQTLQQATANGVAVVPWGADPTGTAGTDYVTYVDWDTVDAGRQWATWIADALGGEGNVVFLGGFPGNAVAMQQLQGINEVFADNPGITLLTGTDTFAPTNWDPAVAQENMTALLGQYDDIDGVITNYGTDAVGVIRAFEEAGRELVPMTSLEANQLACDFEALKADNPRYELATISSRNWLGRVAARKAIAAAQKLTNDEATLYALPITEDTINGLAPICDPSLAPDQYLSNKLTAEDLTTYGVPTQ